MIGNMMPGRNSHIFNGHDRCIFCDALLRETAGYDCPREPAIETLMHQAISAAEHRPCGHRPCRDEFPAVPSRWCSGCLITALCVRVGWAVPGALVTPHAQSPSVGRGLLSGEQATSPAPENLIPDPWNQKHTVRTSDQCSSAPSVGNTTTDQEKGLTTRVDSSSFANSPIATTAGTDRS